MEKTNISKLMLFGPIILIGVVYSIAFVLQSIFLYLVVVVMFILWPVTIIKSIIFKDKYKE